MQPSRGSTQAKIVAKASFSQSVGEVLCFLDMKNKYFIDWYDLCF